MKHIFTLSICFLALSLSAQETITYPYNPDGDADGNIAISDLQDILGVYGNVFTPSEITYDTLNLSELISSILQRLDAIEEFIDSNDAESTSSIVLEPINYDDTGVAYFNSTVTSEVGAFNTDIGYIWSTTNPEPTIYDNEGFTSNPSYSFFPNQYSVTFYVRSYLLNSIEGLFYSNVDSLYANDLYLGQNFLGGTIYYLDGNGGGKVGSGATDYYGDMYDIQDYCNNYSNENNGNWDTFSCDEAEIAMSNGFAFHGWIKPGPGWQQYNIFQNSSNGWGCYWTYHYSDKPVRCTCDF